ncbi:Mth938-like domain-containing protein [Fodinibius salsisoli]|uniref:Mth938-like domain-containing protein n=1 Tax=Fodinibius salsisoli TaxID=2820877 RepID=A0ABT3PLQ0_9BACT|nr:Mth938-like domain-containing protein [Fodinibius salsisoli]MCW9706795.1 Mth938-like domain-containing protein [Fodinibius salsisoli]
MPTNNLSPKINSIKWGSIKTDEGQQYKDAKLYPGGSRAWDWNETGTHHTPGIQPADVEELLDHGAEIVILSRGFHERLQTSRKTEQFLTRKDIPYHILQTESAVDKYNELRKDHKVGALIHSTC